jgi:hypothetical protein
MSVEELFNRLIAAFMAKEIAFAMGFFPDDASLIYPHCAGDCVGG